MSEMCNDAKTKCQFYTCVLKNRLVTADKGSLINLTTNKCNPICSEVI